MTTDEQTIQQLIDRLDLMNHWLHRKKAEEAFDKLVEIGVPAVIPLSKYCGKTGHTAQLACRVLEQIGSDATAPLIDVLENGDVEAQECAAYGLFVLKDKQALDSLVVMALSNKSPKVRRASIVALRWLDDSRVIEPLIELLNGDESNLVRAEAAEALGNLKACQAVEPLLARLTDQTEDVGVRLKAAGALSWMREKRAVSPLIELLEDEDWRLRAKAAFFLGCLGDKKALPYVREHLNDKDKRVRKDVKSALAIFDRQRREEGTA